MLSNVTPKSSKPRHIMCTCNKAELQFGGLTLMEEGKPENPEKNHWSKDENQQQTQPTCDARSGGDRTRATAVGGERSHHCAI